MECNVVKDLIPLYIDECCSDESRKIVTEHIENCAACKKFLEKMEAPSDTVMVSEVPMAISKINNWKASVMQSALLFLSFAIITVGVALEAGTPYGPKNGYWALNLVVPATGFMLSLANWYFVRFYKSRKSFSVSSLLVTLCITDCAYIWACLHFEINIFELIAGRYLIDFFEIARGIQQNRVGMLLSVVFCVLSKILSNKYAKMLGKE